MKILDTHSSLQGQRSLFIHRQGTIGKEELLYADDSDLLQDEDDPPQVITDGHGRAC